LQTEKCPELVRLPKTDQQEEGNEQLKITRIPNLAVDALLAGILLLSPIASFGQEHKAPAHSWNYSQAAGPNQWAELSAEFATCKLGHQQSPIDIRETKEADLPPILFDYKSSPLRIIDNGHTVQVDYAPGSSISVGGNTYQLIQFHFHHPSENQIRAKKSELELHLVHSDVKGNKVVVAVLINPGRSNEFLQSIFDHIPHSKEKEESSDVTLDATNLLPQARPYYTFSGSLTTPPCSEGVTWFVLKNPVEASDSQIKIFAKIYENNARPVQPLSGRTVLESQ
jgi:carbonic anhydrase